MRYVGRGIYDPGLPSQEASWEASVTRGASSGLALEQEFPYIAEAATLDREAHYRWERVTQRKTVISGQIATDSPGAASLGIGQRIYLSIPIRAIARAEYEIIGIERGQDFHSLRLSPWSSAVFSYTAGQITSQQLVPDYSRTIPDAPTGLTVTAQSPVALTFRREEITLRVRATAPRSNVSHLRFTATRDGGTVPAAEASVSIAAGEEGSVLLAVQPELDYVVECRAFAAENDPGFQLGPSVSSAVISSLGDARTQSGITYRELYAFRVQSRTDAAPAQPVTGSFDFETALYVPPNGFTGPGFPAHTPDQIVYGVVATAQNFEGDIWMADLDDWSLPVAVAQDGSLNAAYRRFSSPPSSAPAPSAGVPSGSYDMVENVPSGSGSIYISVGIRPAGSNNFVWQLWIKAEGQDGNPGVSPPRPPGVFADIASSWSTSAANAAVTAELGSGNPPVQGDIVTLHNSSNTFVQTRRYNGSSWVVSADYIDGGTVIDGTVINSKIASLSAAKINTGVLTAGGTNHPTGVLIQSGADLDMKRSASTVSVIYFRDHLNAGQTVFASDSDDNFAIALAPGKAARSQNMAIGVSTREWDFLSLYANLTRIFGDMSVSGDLRVSGEIFQSGTLYELVVSLSPTDADSWRDCLVSCGRARR